MLAYLATQDLALPKGRAQKLLPKYIGPYKIVKADRNQSRYTLELPEELVKRHIHPVFHVTCLRPHIGNNDELFPKQEVSKFYDFGTQPDQEWLVDKIVGHTWEKNNLKFRVQWDQGNHTWEPYNECKDLEALDKYLALWGIKNWCSLSKQGYED